MFSALRPNRGAAHQWKARLEVGCVCGYNSAKQHLDYRVAVNGAVVAAATAIQAGTTRCARSTLKLTLPAPAETVTSEKSVAGTPEGASDEDFKVPVTTITRGGNDPKLTKIEFTSTVNATASATPGMGGDARGHAHVIAVFLAAEIL